MTTGGQGQLDRKAFNISKSPKYLTVKPSEKIEKQWEKKKECGKTLEREKLAKIAKKLEITLILHWNGMHIYYHIHTFSEILVLLIGL